MFSGVKFFIRHRIYLHCIKIHNLVTISWLIIINHACITYFFKPKKKKKKSLWNFQYNPVTKQVIESLLWPFIIILKYK